jgi:hypothetical protein
MRHFVGRVFYLDKIAQEKQENDVEIEVLDNDNPSTETIIQTDDEDLSVSKKDRKILLLNRLRDLGIPFQLIKSNKFVSIEGQIELIKKLRNDELSNYYFTNNLPLKEVNRLILSAIYDYLFTDDNKGRIFNNEVGKSKLISLTNFYLYKKPPFKALLESDSTKKYSENEDTKIRYVFDLVSKYFEFIWPRYIKVFESLYNFVAIESRSKEINLDMVIATLEYGTANTHEILLKDAGLPNEIIKKVSKYFSECTTPEDIQKVRNEKKEIISNNVHPIEMRIIERYI